GWLAGLSGMEQHGIACHLGGRLVAPIPSQTARVAAAVQTHVTVIVIVVGAAGGGSGIGRGESTAVVKVGFEVHAKASAEAETVQAVRRILAVQGERGGRDEGEREGKDNLFHRILS